MQWFAITVGRGTPEWLLLPYEEGKTTSNAKRKRRTTVRLSLSKKQYSIFMLRAAARIQSNLLCKFINSGSMYLGIYTREEKMCPSGRGFSSVFARKRGFEREAARKTIVFRQPHKRRLLSFTVFFPCNRNDK